MSTVLTLNLLGAYRVALHDQPLLHFKTNKVRALLAYLASEARPHERSALAGLLWPGMPEPFALRNLTQTLVRLRQAIADATAKPPFLLLTRTTVQFNAASDAQVDVTRFVATATTGLRTNDPAQLESALALYQGELLAGFALADSEAFDEWLLLKREHLHRLAVDTAYTLTAAYLAAGDYTKAQTSAQRQLALDGWREVAHRQLMEALACSGQRNAALLQYETCRRVLLAELGVAPEPATTALAEQIRTESAGEGTSSLSVAPALLHNLPAQLTTLVGRTAEMAQVIQQILDPMQRLVTLAGLGGVGKTQLALAAAQTIADTNHQGQFRDGIWFVGLAGITPEVNAPNAVATAIASALQFTPSHQIAVLQQVVEYLRHRQLLLILDNFEHLLIATEVVLQILNGAPQVKLLVTSRVRLKLAAETVLTLEGLAVPDKIDDPKAAEFSSVNLFLNLIQRYSQNFIFPQQSLADIIHICRLVEGLPLGIELAASWASHFALAEIAQAIGENLALLENTRRDRAEHHSNLYAVFDYSWGLLTSGEQRVLAQLAIFRGSFSRSAALAVTSAKLVELAALVDKCLLRLVGPGRYQMHELVRQFAMLKLSELEPTLLNDVQSRHSTYYLTFVGQSAPALYSERFHHALLEIRAEMENIQQACKWAIDDVRLDEIDRYISGLASIYYRQGLYQEGQGLLHALLACVRTPTMTTPGAQQRWPQLLSRLLVEQAQLLSMGIGGDQAILTTAQAAIDEARLAQDGDSEAGGYLYLGIGYIRQGQLTLAQQALTQSLALVRIMPAYHAPTPGRGHATLEAAGTSLLAFVCILQERQAEAKRYAEVSLALYRQAGDRWGEARTLHNIGGSYRVMGYLTKALTYQERSLAAAQQIESLSNSSHALLELARIWRALGDPAQAETYAAQAIRLKRNLGDRLGEGHALEVLSRLASQQGNYPVALNYSQQALSLAADIGDRGMQARALTCCGVAYLALGNNNEATLAFQASFDLFQALGEQMVACEPLAGLARVALQQGALPQAQIYVTQLLAKLPDIRGSFLDEPLIIYLTCYRVLLALNDAYAQTILNKAYQFLQQWVLAIDDLTLRQQFVENIITHRDIVEAWSRTAYTAKGEFSIAQ